MDYTVREFGLQLDQPPSKGNISSLAVLIMQNDNVEGILEIQQNYLNITGKNEEKSKKKVCFETLDPPAF